MSPFRRCLYRTAGGCVICLLLLAGALGQTQKRASRKGPRALGLVQLAASGRGYLVPIAILDEGKFYDAGIYKATPVPMALEPGTVYEATKTGVSQGLFTVSGATQVKDAWIGQGSWQAAGAAPAKAAAVESKPREDVDEPPRLQRPGSEKPKPPEAKPEDPKPPAPGAAPPENASTTSSAAPPPEDKDRPVLRRGKPGPQSQAEEIPALPPGKPTTKTSSPGKTSGAIQWIPAISDADGPDPQPYTYDLKPDEEAQLRKKMLALATAEVMAGAEELTPTLPQAKPAKPRKGAAAPQHQPAFREVHLRALDLSNSNEPVLVLTAQARMPGPPAEYSLALVARQDTYGELHKAFSSVTDAPHQDVLPRLEFMDAVDADGDGRGELLFRRDYHAGSAYVIYRVIGNQLWALFEGTPE